ncbi:MAG: hypothetical protein ABIG44_12130 [Planctomycetota bacterium]
MAKAKRRKKATRKPVARKRAARSGRGMGKPGRRARASIDVFGTLAVARDELMAQRQTLDAQISALDNAMATMGTGQPSGTAAHLMLHRGGASGGGRRAGSLKVYINKVMTGHKGTMAVKDIAAGVLRAGYKTKNKTLAKSVGIALTQMPEAIRVGRGQFRLK